MIIKKINSNLAFETYHACLEANYLWMIVEEGTVSCKINGYDIVCSHGLLYFPHSSEIPEITVNPDCKGWMMLIPNDIALEMDFSKDMGVYARACENPYIRLKSHDLAILGKYMSLCSKIADKEAIDNQSIELHYLIQAFTHACCGHFDRAATGASSRLDYLAKSFIKLVSENCTKERKMDFYADKLGVTPKYLSTVMTRVTGCQASKWIEKHTITRAKSLLKSTSMSINEISDALSFITASDFSKYFRKSTGLSPNEFRKLK